MTTDPPEENDDRGIWFAWHVEQARVLLDTATTAYDTPERAIAEAQVHATLAVALATADAGGSR